MSEFVLKIQDLEETLKDFAFVITTDWLKNALSDTDCGVDPANENGSLAVQAQLSGDDIVVLSAIQTSITAPCARCLEPVALPVSTNNSSVLSPMRKRGPLPEDLELSQEDLEVTFFSGDQIVLDDFVRETVLLEVPMRLVCNDGCDSEHVRKYLGDDPDNPEPKEKIDPRLAPLMEMMAAMKRGQKE